MNMKHRPEGHIWHYEKFSASSGQFIRIDSIVHSEQSDFQKITVFDNEDYGRVLLIDDMMMLTQRDEFVYHEMITHVPVNISREISDVLIIGGGDLGTVRELSKFTGIERIKLIEIDSSVIEISKKYLPFLTEGIREDADISIDDGIKYIEDSEDMFDLIIVDGTDPIGPGKVLFSEEFLSGCSEHLRPGGLIAMQGESPFAYPEASLSIHKNLQSAFRHIRPYLAYIPSYPSGMWQFFIASNTRFRYLIDAVLPESRDGCRYYNQDVHNGAFALPEFVRKMYNL
ncbi:MAG: polyamine aminopropyltransferase [candidate division WOR-3 bacterium]|nr:polyamine aminopropyltransferase [candidate division WOR-3 bacterium]